MTVPIDEIQKLLESKQYIVEGDKHRRVIRSLLEENNMLRDVHATMNMEDELERKQLREENEWLKAERQAWKSESEAGWESFWRKNDSLESLRSELAAKDKVLEWYGETSTYESWGEGVPVWEDKGTLARSILEQYAQSAFDSTEIAQAKPEAEQ